MADERDSAPPSAKAIAVVGMVRFDETTQRLEYDTTQFPLFVEFATERREPPRRLTLGQRFHNRMRSLLSFLSVRSQ